ncbi:hypothetical protein ACHAWX_003668 [Stephanocyclus meneghinianus]
MPRMTMMTMAMSTVLVFLFLPALAQSFCPPQRTVPSLAHRHRSIYSLRVPKENGGAPPSSTSALGSSSDNNDDGSAVEARLLKEKADKYRKEAEKLRLNLELKKIDELEGDIRELATEQQQKQQQAARSAVHDDATNRLDQLKERVANLVRGSTVLDKEEADKMLAGIKSSSNSVGKELSRQTLDNMSSSGRDGHTDLSQEDIKVALSLIESLPRPAREALARTAGYSSYGAIGNQEEFVQKLYDNKDKSSMALRRTYAQSFTDDSDVSVILAEDLEESYTIEEMSDILVSELKERIEGNRAMELFPKSVQDANESLLPSEEDAQAFFKLLDQNTFMATEKPFKVNGGYLIRGVNKRNTASELVGRLDEKIAREIPKWKDSFQWSYVEITADPESEEFFEDAILITPNKFPVQAPVALSILVTAISCFYTFVYGIDMFAGNPVVMDRLKEASEKSASLAAAGVPYDLTWFNDLLLPLLGTLALVQGFHEAGHLLVAWLNKIKLSSPTILPSKALPYLSFQNRLTTSPKDYTALFDLAAAGPITGLTLSFLALLSGLQLTTTVDSATAQLLPSLPVGFLCQSSLGGTLVDMILGGGDGILINQEAATQIPLHPIAIAGFVGMIINALDLLPIGSTDGGRMSQVSRRNG